MLLAQIYETLAPLNGQVNHNTLAFIRRANVALDKWWSDCDELHSTPVPFSRIDLFNIDVMKGKQWTKIRS